MEKDIDEVGKIARIAKSKIEELDKEVCHYVPFWMWKRKFMAVWSRKVFYCGILIVCIEWWPLYPSHVLIFQRSDKEGKKNTQRES